MSKKLEEYLNLLELSYHDAVNVLLQKYGSAKDSYFKEKSYARLLNGEIKTPTKGQISRTAEGLYCHHILENKYLNMAQPTYITNQQIPYEVQQAEYLVYADVFEHLILHSLISKETKSQYGYPGYDTYLKPLCVDWYVNGLVPTRDWELNCYNKAYLDSNETKLLFQEADKNINLVERLINYF